ncbi:hypothetical protein [Pseudomonas sp. TWP3-1]|uniref:hypothetical protein n=1 Tax=Pseudomonas sp. TWP3-1 TaxID=2804631 RepID=UPI003CEA5656
MTNSIKQQDYQDSMLIAAKGFLVRHHSEHLHNDTQLLSRITSHLVATLNVDLPIARRLAELAYSEWNDVRSGQCIDLGASSQTTVEIYEPTSGMSWSVPVDLIYERIIVTEGESLRRSCTLF